MYLQTIYFLLPIDVFFKFQSYFTFREITVKIKGILIPSFSLKKKPKQYKIPK